MKVWLLHVGEMSSILSEMWTFENHQSLFFVLICVRKRNYLLWYAFYNDNNCSKSRGSTNEYCKFLVP